MLDHVIARTAWAEARGQGAQGMAAVINVIMNRAAIGGWYGDSPVSVCLKPHQFSCWNENDPNKCKLVAVTEDDEEFNKAVILEELALARKLKDVTNGATHYHAKNIRPKWAKKLRKVATIGSHVFYR